MEAVALVIDDWYKRLVDGNFAKVWPTQSGKLRIKVREQPALQQWVIAYIDSRHHVCGAKRYLFGFCKKVVRITVKRPFCQLVLGEPTLQATA